MKTTAIVARILLGLIFTLFGLNGFLHFLQTPPPTGLGLQYFQVLSQSGYMTVVFFVQLVGGVLLLLGLYVPFALAILGPVIVNILTFHFLMNPEGLPLALVVTVLWLFLAWAYRDYFRPLFTPRAVVREHSARGSSSSSTAPAASAS